MASQNFSLERAARRLASKLEMVHADACYRQVWETAQLALGTPYDGPTYTEELAALNALLRGLEKEEPSLDADYGQGDAVHHLDGDANDDPENLRIVDPRENRRGE
jgi:hypothetical protein